MKTITIASLLVVALMNPTAVCAQPVIEDVQLNFLKDIRWQMTAREIMPLLQKGGCEATETKESVASIIAPLGLSTKLKLQFDKFTKELNLISAQVEKPTQSARDSVVDHFTRTLGPPGAHENKKQRVAIIELDVEMLKWKTQTSMVVVTIMKHGADFVNVSFVLFPTTSQN